jgi:hypothetical protein
MNSNVKSLKNLKNGGGSIFYSKNSKINKITELNEIIEIEEKEIDCAKIV